MPVVFVHGNPETAAIWQDLILHLERTDVVTLSPPGFGAPVPEGFGATPGEYVEWLASELRKLSSTSSRAGGKPRWQAVWGTVARPPRKSARQGREPRRSRQERRMRFPDSSS